VPVREGVRDRYGGSSRVEVNSGLGGPAASNCLDVLSFSVDSGVAYAGHDDDDDDDDDN
jgi:hypothetical protein